jgi:hypothetical protein
MKKPEEAAAGSKANVIGKAWLERTRACHEAASLLSNLKLSLVQHEAALSRLELRACRFCDEVKRVIYNRGTACLQSDPTVLAGRLVRGEKALDAIILEEQRLLEPRYRKINFGMTGSPADDLVAYKELEGERAAVLILKAAISLQKTASATVNKASMEKFSHAAAEARAETALSFLAAFAQLQAAVKGDQAIADGLEPEDLQCLRPRPFPLRILSAEVREWLLDSLAEGMIQPTELTNVLSFALSAPTE